MNRFFIIALAGLLCFSAVGCSKQKNSDTLSNPMESDPMIVIPAIGDEKTVALIYEVPAPEPYTEKGEMIYPIYYGGEVAVTKSRAEWESWLEDPSKAPLPALQNDRNFVLTWCDQFAEYWPEQVGLILMNYFEYDLSYLYLSNPWCYTINPQIAFFNWAGLRRCIENRKVVCAGYAQFFYLIVKQKNPDVKYITSDEICHARNIFEGYHWDLTWLDDKGVDYNPDKIKFDFVGMQKRISDGINGNVGHDWIVVNLVDGR